MFVNQTHLPQLLGGEFYTSPEIHDREIEQLFRPGWHCVGTLADLPNDGDYLTLTLCGQPLLIWRKDGGVHAFLNVCAHRFSVLTDKPCGHFGGQLKCRYHGWEFDTDGNTCRIPDARSFRPLEKGQLGLKPYRAELCGQLIFVSLSGESPALRDYLGPLYPLLTERFSDEYRLFWQTELHHQANWKIPAENTLEAYHTTEVHPHTFGDFPDEKYCTHELHGWWDVLHVDYSYKTNRGERLISRLARVEPDLKFQHIMRYPNTVCSIMKLFSSVWTIVPVSPTESRELIWTFCKLPNPESMRSRIAARILRIWVKSYSERIRSEDAEVFPGIQRGLEAGDRPLGGGLISAREERLFEFQRYVLEQLGMEVPAAVRLPDGAPQRTQSSNDASWASRGTLST